MRSELLIWDNESFKIEVWDYRYLTPPFLPLLLAIPLSSALFLSKAANSFPVLFWWTWNQEPWIRFALAHLDSYSGLITLSLVSGQHSSWTNCTCSTIYIYVSATAVTSSKAVLSCTWEHCTVLWILSTKLLQPLSNVALVWCIVHVQLRLRQLLWWLSRKKKKEKTTWRCCCCKTKRITGWLAISRVEL